MSEIPINPAQAAAFARYQAAARKGRGNKQISISFGEAIEAGRLRRAWQTVSDRHPVLQTVFFRSSDGVLVRQKSDSAGTVWNDIDWKKTLPLEVPEKWNALLAHDAGTPFDTGTGPLVRFQEIQLPGDNKHYLLTIPSFLLDETSIARVLMDWLAALEQTMPAALEEISPLSVTPSPAAWKEILHGCEGPLSLRPRSVSCGEAQASVILDRDQTAAFMEFCQALSLDAGVVLRCLWMLVLRRFGAPGNVSLALYDITPNEVGFFENWLPTALAWDGTIEKWLIAAQKKDDSACKNPFINSDEALSAASCFFSASELSTAFAWRNAELNDVIHTILPRWINFDARIHQNPMGHFLLEARNGSRLHLRVEGPAWTEFMAKDLLEHLSALIESLGKIRNKPVLEVPVLFPEEARMLQNWSQGPDPAEHPFSAIAAFQKVSLKYPQAIAVRDSDYELTYAELDRLSDKMAAHLAHAGFAGGWNVALFLSPSSWISIALLGTWKAGNACLALDPSSPPDWIESALAAHDVGIVICDAASAPLLDVSDRRRIVLDQEWETLETADVPSVEIQADSPAVILPGYSDAPPPSLNALAHGMLLAACYEGARLLDFRPEDTFLAHAVAGGGAFYDEWLIPLFSGGTVCVAGDDVLDVATTPVTHLRLTTPEWTNQAVRWLRGDKSASNLLRVVAVEAGAPKKRALEIWNEHNSGAIRTVVFFSPAGLCGLGLAGTPMSEDSFLPIGKPTAGIEASVCDADGHNIPPMYAGKLVLKFSGWKNVPEKFCPRELGMRLNAWHDAHGDLQIESDSSQIQEIPSHAAREKAAGMSGHFVDVHIGAQTWGLGDSQAPSGAIAVSEWPLNRAGWIDESALPEPESSSSAVQKSSAPAISRAVPAGPWNPIVVLQEANSTSILVLVHAASGTLDIYRDLIVALGSTRKILGITARGANDPDASHSTIESAAASYIDVLLEEYPSASFVISGFGFGAMISLEIARQLKAAGRSEPKLILIGAHAPTCDKSNNLLSSIKNALKQFSSIGRMEPNTDAIEPVLTHEAAWRQYRFIPGEMSAQIILPSNFSRNTPAAWQAILPSATIQFMKCPWKEMLSFPAVKRLASIMNHGE